MDLMELTLLMNISKSFIECHKNKKLKALKVGKMSIFGAFSYTPIDRVGVNLYNSYSMNRS